jgi:hydroxymethylpyrimidine pyrophosphatase-like HAD family hydrolase
VISLLAVDLDRTLIYSAAARSTLGGDAPDVVCVETYRDAPASFMTGEAARMLAELAERCLVVPVTTRTAEQYRRVQLPLARVPYAVVANGATLLVDGAVDEGWRAVVRRVTAASAPLPDVNSYLEELGSREWATSIHSAADVFVYAVVNPASLPRGAVEILTDWCATRGWTVSLQGRKLYCVPDGVTKSAAVAEIARRVGAHRTLAAGDSLLDADLLRGADAGIHPRHGELFERGFSAPAVVCTSESGIRACEEIVSWFAAQVPPPVTVDPVPAVPILNGEAPRL